MEGTPALKDEQESPAQQPRQTTPSNGGGGYHDATSTSALEPHTLSIQSTESVRTLKGGVFDKAPDAVSTPSYPFPNMRGIPAGIPVDTSGTHKPITARSPINAPSPAMMVESHVSKDFLDSAHVPTHGRGSQGTHGLRGGLHSLKPNILNIATNLQSELGLPGWWNQATVSLREAYGVERATLSVATDATDVENVPWAQLATYFAREDDDISRRTNELESSKASFRDSLSSSSTKPIENITERGTSETFHSVAFASSSSRPVVSRPKLESRHSYTGYPPKQRNNLKAEGFTALAETPTSNTPHRKPSNLQNAKGGGQKEKGMELRADRLERHDAEKSAKEFSTSDVFTAIGPYSGKILHPVQPLESEGDPLITAAGVVRVLQKQHAIVLTRQYRDQPRAYQIHASGLASGKGSTRGTTTEKRKSKSSGAPLSSPKASRSSRSSKEQKSAMSTKLTSSKRYSGSASKGGESSAPAEIKTKAQSTFFPTPYEDYEQFPGTPWAQSPAPSPAPQVDPEENPFFSNLPDQDAFDEAAPDYEYNNPSQIPAIGLDRSQSIIQLPLIHPSATLSQIQSSQVSRSDQISKSKSKSKLSKSDRNYYSVRDSPASEAPHQKRIPIAILSIEAPTVPYPQDLIDSLNELAPILATSFYAARMHSHLLQEVNVLSRRRTPATRHLNLRDEKNNISIATGLNFVGATQDNNFSPISPASTASTSPQSNVHSPKGPFGGGLIAETPGLNTDDKGTTYTTGSRDPRKSSPAIEESDKRDYFEVADSKQSTKDELGLSSDIQRPAPPSRSASSSKKNMLHSHGANFANTQPSLPSAASSYSMNDHSKGLDVPQDVTHAFKEPSSSILRTMIDNGATQQFIAESDSGNLVWANSKFLSYRNASKGNIHEQLWINIYYKDVNGFRSAWNKSLETGDQLSYQVRLKRFDGHYRFFHIRFLPLKDKYGITKYWHGQAMDIHELHEAQAKALRSKEKAASEAKYRAIANSLPVIVFAASVPTGMTFTNTQWLSYSGQALEDALGFGFLDYVHPDDLVKCRFPGLDSRTQSLKDPRNSIGNSLVRTESNVSSTGESDTASVADPTAKIKIQENQLEALIPNELLRGLASDGIIMCTKDGQGNLSITTEMRLKNYNGEYRWHLVQGSYIESVNFGQGEAQWFIACTDISNQKLNEAKIRDANSALETANLTLENEVRRRMDHLSSMAHETRQPLSGIIGNLQFLINSGLNEANSEWAHSAQESAKDMHDLINDILDVSKAEANMLQLTYAWFNPREIMEQVLDMLSSKAAEKRIEFICECSEAVPRILRGDPGRIRQVLLNLAGNAIKFTTYGEVVVNCEVMKDLPAGVNLPSLGPQEIFVKWTVTDTGSGFSEEEKKLLFKPYSQIKNKSTRDTGGTGLGLILCKTMITLHGGLIDAQSKPGKGSSFTFFARFKARKHSTTPLRSGLASPIEPSLSGSGISPLIDSHSKDLYLPRLSAMVDAPRESPAILSDSSSAQSTSSVAFRNSVRSSASTADSGMVIPLSLPSPTRIGGLSDSSRSQRIDLFEKPSSSKSIAPNAVSKLMHSPTTTDPVITKGSPTLYPQSASKNQETATTDLERSKFRPPMLSILIICPAEKTRRITCEQIKFVVPKSAPCNITSEARVDATEMLMFGADPITFTHVVFRVASDELLSGAIKQILDSPTHIQTSIIVLTDPAQVKNLKKSLNHVDLEQLNKNDRVKIVLKPTHVYKLAKIFDPFNENLRNTGDPKEAKRNEEKRLQKESYALFKRVLGDRRMRVMAVEDNSIQMNILCNFLQMICHLEVTKAWNGQECLDLYKSHEPGYFSVIVTDIEMPILDGLTMCRHLREWEEEQDWPPANVVSLSANTFYDGWTQSSLAGFTHYCPKPPDFRDLGHIIVQLTDPNIQHKFLKDREMPPEMLKKLGLLPPGDNKSDDSDDGFEH